MNDYTFLYIEDDDMSREALHMILTRVMRLDRVHVFENSENFMQRLYALPSRPDVILLDIHMRPHDGFALLELLREDPEFSEAVIVAITASVMNEEVDQLKTSGFDGVIGKPISVASFPTLIYRVINGEPIWHVTDL